MAQKPRSTRVLSPREAVIASDSTADCWLVEEPAESLDLRAEIVNLLPERMRVALVSQLS